MLPRLRPHEADPLLRLLAPVSHLLRLEISRANLPCSSTRTINRHSFKVVTDKYKTLFIPTRKSDVNNIREVHLTIRFSLSSVTYWERRYTRTPSGTAHHIWRLRAPLKRIQSKLLSTRPMAADRFVFTTVVGIKWVKLLTQITTPGCYQQVYTTNEHLSCLRVIGYVHTTMSRIQLCKSYTSRSSP